MMVMYIMRHRAVPFLVYISMPEMFQMDSFFQDFEKKGHFFFFFLNNGTYWFLSGFGLLKVKQKYAKIFKNKSVLNSIY